MTTMRNRILICAFAALLAPALLHAQNLIDKGGPEVVDSVVYKPSAVLDATLKGQSVFSVLEKSGVKISQDPSIPAGMRSHIEANASKKLTGYRIRIFFDNKKTSRNDSESALHRFQAAFPGVATYRTFTSPFFKVAVGNFRTKSEASAMLQKVKGMFPAAFIIKEQIDFPAVDRDLPYVVDTVQIYKSPAAL